MRKRLKNIAFRLFSNRLLRKMDNDTKYQYGNLSIDLQPGIFHPKYFKSSQLLLQWIDKQDLTNTTLIEVGCGSGISSLRAAEGGAEVTAIDINPKAVDQLIRNAEKNDLELRAIHSDLFDSVTEKQFNYVLINPPFYPKSPANDAEHAWYCGEGFEYFHKLFRQLNERAQTKGILMTLSDDCDLHRIQSIAAEYNYSFKEIERTKNFWEINYLFEIIQN